MATNRTSCATARTASRAERESMPTLRVGKTRGTFLVSCFSFLVRAEPRPTGSDCQRETRNEKRETSRGITLIKLLVVVAIISLIIDITFPSINSGLESLWLNHATNVH